MGFFSEYLTVSNGDLHAPKKNVHSCLVHSNFQRLTTRTTPNGGLATVKITTIRDLI